MTATAMAPPASQGAGYRALVRRKRWLLLGFFVLTTLSLLLDLALGPVGYSVRDVVQAVLWPDSVPVQLRVVVWDIRLPTALMALAVGAALSVAGAQMQTTLNNPLASPFTLGISAAASFGAALGLAFGVALFPTVAGYVVPLNAFVMAMLSAGLIHLLSMKRGVTTETIVLLGIALVFTFNALLALVQYVATEHAVAAVGVWTMGLLAAFPVAFVGTIGFVGLVGPHIARMLIGEDQRFFLPASVMTGALLLSISSVVSKTLIPGAIFPIGVVTSLIGVPFFISLILGRRERSW